MTGLILMYHRVADAPEDAYGLAVAPERFQAQTEYLSRLGCIVPLHLIRQPTKSLQIAITFDDGYADNADTAAPLLASLRLPVTYFITSGRLGGRHFWWDRLAVGLLEAHPSHSGLDVQVGGRSLWLALNSPDACRISLRFLHRRLRSLPPEELQMVVEEVLARIGASEPPQAARSMTENQLRALSQMEYVDIGAHTRTHLQLRDQARSLQHDEIFGSIADIEAITGRAVTTFAYPFGGKSAVGNIAPRLTREAGCQLACSTDVGVVGPRTDPYRLPRLNVGDWPEDEFAARIEEVRRSA
jgi:peptidoglycan/xylan/chitin deacetylase (PgdA/CDA1 family)